MAWGGARIAGPTECPPDFDEKLVEMGRLACEEHYGVQRRKIDKWLEERGKARLTRARLARRSASRRPCPADFDTTFVSLGPSGCMRRYRTSAPTIRRWLHERGADRLKAARAIETRTSLTREDMTVILAQAFPVERAVSFTVARHAAQFLRIRRNGGWIISPAQHGEWWVGARRRTACELVDLAMRAGFDPANLREDCEDGVGSGQP